jgi:hypothetical protein
LRRPGDLRPVGPPALLNAARDITALGGPSVLTLLTVAVSLFLALEGKKHMALFVCGSIGSGLLVSNLLKNSFDRPRPDIVPHEVYAASYSFPSGHSMLSALTYLTLGAILARAHQRKLLKAYFLLMAVFLTLLISITACTWACIGRQTSWPAGPPAPSGPFYAGSSPVGCRAGVRSNRSGPLTRGGPLTRLHRLNRRANVTVAVREGLQSMGIVRRLLYDPASSCTDS